MFKVLAGERDHLFVRIAMRHKDARPEVTRQRELRAEARRDKETATQAAYRSRKGLALRAWVKTNQASKPLLFRLFQLREAGTAIYSEAIKDAVNYNGRSPKRYLHSRLESLLTAADSFYRENPRVIADNYLLNSTHENFTDWSGNIRPQKLKQLEYGNWNRERPASSSAQGAKHRVNRNAASRKRAATAGQQQPAQVRRRAEPRMPNAVAQGGNAQEAAPIPNNLVAAVADPERAAQVRQAVKGLLSDPLRQLLSEHDDPSSQRKKSAAAYTVDLIRSSISLADIRAFTTPIQDSQTRAKEHVNRIIAEYRQLSAVDKQRPPHDVAATDRQALLKVNPQYMRQFIRLWNCGVSKDQPADALIETIISGVPSRFIQDFASCRDIYSDRTARRRSRIRELEKRERKIVARENLMVLQNKGVGVKRMEWNHLHAASYAKLMGYANRNGCIIRRGTSGNDMKVRVINYLSHHIVMQFPNDSKGFVREETDCPF